MHELDRIYSGYKLKEIQRKNNVKRRQESSAEHTYSTIYLAEYFLKKIKGLDELKVLKLLLYHDLIEIYAGDTFVLDKKAKKTQLKREKKALKKIMNTFPETLSPEIEKNIQELIQNKTREAKFARAIDVFDPIIQAMNQPKAWMTYGFTEKKLREYKEPYFEDFPEIQKFFDELIIELKKRKIIPKK